MDFNLSSEQEILRDGLARFLSTRYSLQNSRAAAKSGPGWRPEIWRGFAEELGILGAVLPEEAGGGGGGPTEVMVIAEELGRALVIEPFIETVVVAGGLLQRAGGETASALLADITSGSAIVALAAGEASDHWESTSTSAVRDGDSWVVNGSKAVVMGAPIATHLLIAAYVEDSLALLLTEFDPDSPPAGLVVHGYRTVGDRRAADLVFTQLRLPGDSLLSAQAWPSLARARDEGAAAVCAEAVGAMRKVLDDTLAYCKQRQQFGMPLGGFQVLQHRMVDMYMELEQAVAATYLATLSIDAEPHVRARAISAAKVTVGRAVRFIGQQAVQLHGGMGMTEELAIGHYFKRLTVLQYEFGSTDHHRARYARLTRPR